MLYSAEALVQTYGLNADNYSVLCYLPLCHVAERICSINVHCLTGGTVNFAESIDTIDTNIREISPTAFLGMPRVWEKHRLRALIGLNEGKPYQKWLFELNRYAVIAYNALHIQAAAMKACGEDLTRDCVKEDRGNLRFRHGCDAAGQFLG